MIGLSKVEWGVMIGIAIMVAVVKIVPVLAPVSGLIVLAGALVGLYYEDYGR